MTVSANIPDDFPPDEFSHSSFERLLRTYVDSNGHLDYQSWYEHTDAVGQLDSYLAAVTQYSPETTPERFVTSNDALAYWLYAYNAYVIKSILDRWPLESVTDVKAPIEIVKGFGFFYRLRFIFGGRAYSLYTIENKKIRAEYRDARIHFVLNCGSESCPILRTELPTDDALETLLQQAAVDFVSDERNVRIDQKSQRIVLSAIFKWYEKDFTNDLRRRGLSADQGLQAYIASIAPDPLRKAIAACVGCKIEFDDYDWTVNRTR